MKAFNPQKPPLFSSTTMQGIWIPWTILCVLLGLVSGWVRLSITGYSPFWIPTMAAVVIALGTMQSLGSHGIRITGRLPRWVLSIGISGLFLVSFWVGMKLAIPGRDLIHFRNAWTDEGIREPVHLLPALRASGLSAESVERNLWLGLQIIEAAVLVIASWATLTYLRPTRKSLGRLRTYRMPMLLLALLGTLIWSNRPHLAEQRGRLQSWVEEVQVKPGILLLHTRTDGVGKPRHSPEYLSMEKAMESASVSASPIPEVDLLQFHEHRLQSRAFLSREAMDRAVFACENLNRRSWLGDGRTIERNQLLAYLYHVRGKLHLENDRHLLAERDLSIALIHYEESLAATNLIPSEGYFRLPAQTLPAATMPGPYDAATAYHDRHLARLALGDESQAASDLEMAQAVVLFHPDRK
jgi:hypothetical protein